VKKWLHGAVQRMRGAGGRWDPGPAMTIVAHPDDDLYFINPAIQVSIAAGAPAIGVVLTAAEGDGINVDTNDPDRGKAPIDHDGYAAARRVGLRRAYAKMAGLPLDSAWRREPVMLGGGWTMERDTLEAAPRIVLYFGNIGHLWPAGKAVPTLVALVDDEIEAAPTMPAADLPESAGREPEQITKDVVIAALAELIALHRPTVVRTLDPDPERDWGRAQYTNSDHDDHSATARFAFLAVQRLAGRDDVPAMEYHRGYANRFWGRNCSPRVHKGKADFVATYAGADGAPHPGYPHGDYQLGTNPYRATHIYSTAQRYTATASWAAALPSGALAAFTVRGDRLLMWQQSAPGSGRWRGPMRAQVTGLMPTLAVAHRAGGPVHVVGLRRVEDGKGIIDVEAGYLEAGVSGPGQWVPLGGPDAADPDRRRQRLIGVPAATVDHEGRLWVFVRDFTGGLSVRRQTATGWSDWEQLPGGPRPLQDVPVATTTDAGLVEVYAAAKGTIASWRQTAPGGTLTANNTLKSTPVASGGLHVVRTGGDRACLFFRQAGSGTILAYREHGSGRWPGGPAALGGHDGLGPVAAIGRPVGGAGDMVMAQRNRFWTVSTAVPPAGEGSRWKRMPGMIAGAPALATDATGRAVLMALGLDGRLHVSRPKTAEPGGLFEGWQTV
jgi:LmbE family N-acetylglucosaminyl deacetylase